MLSTLIGASLIGSVNTQAFALPSQNEVLTEASTSDVETEVSTNDVETEISTSDVETEVSTSDVETEVSTSDVETETSTEIEKIQENVGVSQVSENTYDMGPSARAFSSITLDGWVPNPGPNSTGYYQKFTRTGFQPYIYRGAFLYKYHGFVKSFTDKKFEVLTGFFTLNGRLYYSDAYGNSKTGLQNIDGNYYYFNENLSNPYAVKGWMSIGEDRYYFNSDYQAEVGPAIIDGKVYFFDDEGHLMRGLVEEEGKTYLFNNRTGQQITGWYSFNKGKRNETRYYFDPLNGGAAHEGWYYGDSAGKMYFDDRGRMAKGVTKVGDDYYLLLTNGAGSNAYVKSGWYSDGPKRYYFDPRNGGRAVRDTVRQIDGYWYRFDSEGALVN